MKVKSLLAKPLAYYVHSQIKRGMQTAVSDQEAIFKKLISAAAQTEFGRDHNFAAIASYADYKQAVPIRDYEQLKP